jgi:two-component system, OmpR family, sensor histidine kinase CreC
VIVALRRCWCAVFVQEVKPGVRQAMEDTLVDTANVLAELARDDLLAGRIAETASSPAACMRCATRHRRASGVSRSAVNYRVYVTDARGIVVFDSAGQDVGPTTRAGTTST